MPHKAVSVFHYAAHHGDVLGSIWAQSMAGGCDYEQYWSQVRYGRYWQMPLNYLNKIDTMSFPRVGPAKERPVGDQMRHYLTTQGKAYTEMMCFENWDGYVDVFMHVSTWEPDLWSHYKIEDQAMPEHWHESTTMTWVSNDLWTMEALRERKRKHDEVDAGAMNFEEEPLSEDAAIYQTVVDAMTPTRLPPDSPIEQGGAVVLSKTRFSLFLCNSIFYSKSMFVFGIGRLLFEFCCYICCSILVCFVLI